MATVPSGLAAEVVVHLVAEPAPERARIREQRQREQRAPHVRAPFSSRRERAAATCPSSRGASALATAMPRAVSR